jgi:hypothetical protein
MGVFEMVVAIVAISCTSGLVKAWIDSRVAIAKTREVRGNDAMQAQIDTLREEVRQLKEQHHDAILSFDTTLRHLGAPGASTNLAQQPAGSVKRET